MGNSYNKSSQYRDHNRSFYSNQDGQALTSQFSLPHFIGNLSGRSFVSLSSNQSVYSASRPWSRVGRRRWNDSTQKNNLEASKTAWPISHRESIFLPEFPITANLLQKDYQIVTTIAKGAFGEVIKIKKISNGKDYALKILSKSQVVSERAVNQVKEEARIQSACGHHCFIAAAVSRWQTKKTLYIVSEYIPGGELLDLLNKYKILPEELVKVFVAEIAVAIDFLHNAGVIYRDLKPENILLDNEYHIRLIDFGLSKWLSFGTRTTTLCGTLKYMAPEVLSREPYGHAVDWWSLGVIACRMLTNEYPASAFKEDDDVVDRVATDVMNNFETLSIEDSATTSTAKGNGRPSNRLLPGTLPESAANLTAAPRALLMHLLERDPKVRMRSLRQMQQSAFYMGFNFEHVKAKKISPKSIMERHFDLDEVQVDILNTTQNFETFDQPPIMK